ncbi:hypothetical protein [Streptomyces sp. NPDC008139]|uniref:hypothetical protein n=1 Tax=Streptomyces sp. NPDC008139 TaxID=3364814 RepID=UPI0036E49793
MIAEVGGTVPTAPEGLVGLPAGEGALDAGADSSVSGGVGINGDLRIRREPMVLRAFGYGLV